MDAQNLIKWPWCESFTLQDHLKSCMLEWQNLPETLYYTLNRKLQQA